MPEAKGLRFQFSLPGGWFGHLTKYLLQIAILDIFLFVLPALNASLLILPILDTFLPMLPLSTAPMLPAFNCFG